MLGCCRIMVVEDEALIALDLAMTIEEMGGAVCGPFSSVDRAVACSGEPDAAILDVDLRCGTVIALADRLRAAGTPFAFHTARSDLAPLRRRYGLDVPILRKPARGAALRDLLRTMIEGRLLPPSRAFAPVALRPAS